MLRNGSLTVIAALAGAIVWTGAASAQDCPRGDLDKAYCDRNGDLSRTCRPIPSRSSIRRR